MSITKVQIGAEAVFAAGNPVTIGHELRKVAHAACCASGPQVDAEAAGQWLLTVDEVLAWADGALRRHDPEAADARERLLRVHANFRKPSQIAAAEVPVLLAEAA